MLDRSRQHPKRDKGSPDPILFLPIPNKPNLHNKNKKQMHRAMSISTMRNTQRAGHLIRPMSQVSAHRAKPSPDNMISRVDTDRTIQEITIRGTCPSKIQHNAALISNMSEKDRAKDGEQFDDVLRTIINDTNKFENRFSTIRAEETMLAVQKLMPESLWNCRFRGTTKTVQWASHCIGEHHY